MKNIIKFIGIILAILVPFSFIVSVVALTPSDRIIKQDENNIYVMHYSLFAKDSTINKYPADVHYTGVVIDKKQWTTTTFVHSGKSSIPVMHHHYKVVIKYNNTTYNETNNSFYNKLNIGDSVKIRENWYPHHNISICN